MKKIITIMLVLFSIIGFSQNFSKIKGNIVEKENGKISMKYRYSESTIEHPIVEYTQGGILLRFNIKDKQVTDEDGNKTKIYYWREFWVQKDDKFIKNKVNKQNHILSNKHKELIK